ncbi:helix-turn-helix transcriptional regulator [Isoptericola sp. NPDC056578]|uniref:helix-turn-helix transcriptional regulator n=1 Tax=Isoptericola sp. NPDC056578 TaxID=3345870 RepID=UPI0036A1A597
MNWTRRKIENVKQVSERTGIPEGTLRAWRHEGDKGPRSFKAGRRIAYYEDDVDAWLEARYAETGRGGVVA